MGREARAREAAGLPPYLVVRELGLEAFEAKVCARMEQGYVPTGGVMPFPAKTSPLAGAVTSIAYIQAMVLLEPEEEISGEGVSVEIPGAQEV